MTATELKINALILIEIGTPEEQEEGRNTLRMLRDGLFPTPTLDDTVDELLEELNLMGGLNCCQMIRTALIQAYQRPGLMDCASSGIYKKVAEIYQVTPKEVGRSINRGIEIMYRLGDSTALNDFFQVSTE